MATSTQIEPAGPVAMIAVWGGSAVIGAGFWSGLVYLAAAVIR